ncbi:MAG: rhomboid family intramembrane serine protease [Saprospiraceae bacterium]|nr:rhomboid family intramembrane serine protease [Saprospiraceae bacterium]
MEKSFSQKMYSSIGLPLKFILVLWGIHLLQLVLPIDFAWLGIYPGRPWGLRGILFAPLIHSSFGHLLSNSIPLLMLGAIIMFFYRRVALRSFLLIYFLTGLAVWIFGRPVFHIGASGVVYGLVAFVFWNGIFRRNLKSIVLALLVVFYYGSMFLGIVPGQEGISWESHLMGGIVGILVSFLFRDQIEEDERPRTYSWEEEENDDGEGRYFLDRDAFDRTRSEQERERQGGDWFSNHT